MVYAIKFLEIKKIGHMIMGPSAVQTGPPALP